MQFKQRIRSYYAALRAGDPLGEFFADEDSIVKFGISDRLAGGSAITEGLSTQTDRTTDWVVDSKNLIVYDASTHACFSDEVRLEWTDTVEDERYEFDTRWSGTLELKNSDTEASEDDLIFIGMHVSTPRFFR
ncbi:hypothetical protein [Haloquadratum walsbyi]|jgi:hypothetical protein|uniref:SnoaL-like domain-containing protein n=1 Tax=Haloquadratum walsbyi J07HQW2 TaxID=1238425 RepID=U1PXE7_9EURY|nr:hypothetical protein [Haloquadratum walsbyi]ERG97131.1 MAG: hypothetical protein J07HQW2_03617 [Haloquadratum walsbyi J07HQW2]